MGRGTSSPDERSVEVRAPVPAVVLADGAGRAEFDALHRVLGQAMGCPVVRFNGADPPASGATMNLVDGALEMAGMRVRPVVAWVRHAAAVTIYSRRARGYGVAGWGPREAQSLREAESWSGLLDLVATTASVAVPGGRPGLARQLADAGRHGLRVPRTVVTTDVDGAMGILRVSRVVVKVPDARLVAPAPRGRPVPVPQVLERGGAVEWMDGAYPAVVQEYVEHARELRVYVADGGVCAFEVTKPAPGSIWTEPELVTVRRVACPDPLVAATRALARAWRMCYGAFDILLTRSGSPVFLEANADGDWLWYERKAGWHGVSFMVATMLKEMLVRTLATDRGARCPRT